MEVLGTIPIHSRETLKSTTARSQQFESTHNTASGVFTITCVYISGVIRRAYGVGRIR
ncbi:hypothetical protein PISMIDRAFT_689443 [Pisolithus microcarpus 441]|uniref:Uncharacterized protein n=1 Tax=Pisolithus microcarpus 441 TaxID=765257 RepID=A0A0C9YQ89_9AGAM|nr:hypothetical protein BKA83DRAFT_689443 [Pisolithus microcarpus]KIK12492.1 hypothetical protein PISMIDRAFT_689443 [Pisolithus microcarpus 441]